MKTKIDKNAFWIILFLVDGEYYVLMSRQGTPFGGPFDGLLINFPRTTLPLDGIFLNLKAVPIKGTIGYFQDNIIKEEATYHQISGISGRDYLVLPCRPEVESLYNEGIIPELASANN